ncbi:cupin domain-containing protein [Phyllobacterium sp. 628]|uniref:cupin domain-containing protein n=1 Tax=Phyllobacterium sp. 628 TaxID=2718938 RepID=UPI0016628994|nr:cupin domain-containing protein [Phyllobacterium sp. 628]QND53633.1 cupin domain-containing protein [Phyllobacterium sp. 628]
MAYIINREDWAESAELWKGEFTGKSCGTNVSVIFYSTHKIGGGPDLHTHPYPETFIIRSGNARFTVGDEVIDAHAGQIVIAPANIPHKFKNLGPDLLETIDIHANDVFITEWLE